MTQVYGSCKPSDVADFQVRLSACVDDIAAWMLANRLQLSPARLSCSGARHLVVVSSCPCQLSGSAQTSSTHRRQSATSASTSTPTSACSENSCQLLRRFTPHHAQNVPHRPKRMLVALNMTISSRLESGDN